MGGSLMKGMNNNGSRGGRSYGMMLLIAFGAALLGVMFLHKLREKRVFNLLLHDKDRELFSLQLLLQKERDQGKKIKMKNEEMKSKIYSVRSQNMELERRLAELQSTIDSLKDEQRTIESALEIKDNEIKVLGSQKQIENNQNHLVTTLTESLKQKEVEIEKLKHQLDEYSPSKYPQGNLTSTVNGENTTKSVQDGGFSGEKTVDKEVKGNKNEDTNNGLRLSEEKNIKNENETTDQDGQKEERSLQEDSARMEGSEKNGGSSMSKMKGKRWRRDVGKKRRLESRWRLNGIEKEEASLKGRKYFRGDDLNLTSNNHENLTEFQTSRHSSSDEEAGNQPLEKESELFMRRLGNGTTTSESSTRGDEPKMEGDTDNEESGKGVKNVGREVAEDVNAGEVEEVRKDKDANGESTSSDMEGGETEEEEEEENNDERR